MNTAKFIDFVAGLFLTIPMLISGIIVCFLTTKDYEIIDDKDIEEDTK